MARRVIPIVIIVIVVVGVAFIGYLLAGGGPSGPIVNYKNYTNENYSFKLDLPDNWVVSGLGKGYLGNIPDNVVDTINWIENNWNETGFYLSPPTLDAWIVVGIFKKSGGFVDWFDNHLGASLDNMTRYISFVENEIGNDNLFVLRSKPTKIAVNSHYGVRYSFSSPTSFIPQNLLLKNFPPFPFRIQVEEFALDNYFYSLQAYAAEENFPIYEPIFQHVIDSFSFLD